MPPKITEAITSGTSITEAMLDYPPFSHYLNILKMYLNIVLLLFIMNKKILITTLCLLILVGVVAVTADTNIVGAEIFNVRIVSPLESNGGLPVNIQDQTTPPVDFFFLQATGAPTTLAENASIDSINVTLTDTTGFVDGTYVGIFCPDENRFYFAEQLGAPVGNVIVLDTPIDFNFTTGDFVQPLTRDLNVDGSTTTQSFIVTGPGPTSDIEIDINRIMISMETDSAVSLSTFGDLAKLTKGIVLRRTDGDVRNIWNVKSNGEIAQLSYDYDPHQATNPVQGQDGANFRYTFNGQDKHGVAVRIGAGESLELLIQDDLSGLESFRIIAEGHIVTD